VRAYCHPRQFAPVSSVLLHNNGDGTFTDASASSGIAAHPGKALGVAIHDFDRDGRIDLFVANDSMPQFLFRNAGAGVFAEVALEAGVAYDDDGRTFAGMGTDVEDYDGDGWPDVIVTTLSLERYALFRGAGRGRFEYASHATGVGRATLQKAGWGTKFIDFDNDGRRDLFVAQGHVLDTVSGARQGFDYLQAPLMLRNQGLSFSDVSASLGPAFARPAAGRGAAFADLDDDGDIDIVIANLDSPPTILRNDDRNANRWLTVSLRGTRSNRDGIGAMVTVVDDQGRTQSGVCSTASSYQSASDRRVHFGLGGANGVQRVEVRWPSGTVQVLKEIAADRILEIVEPAPEVRQ
jgi:enediyne biosynthesis protein E4